MNIFLLITSRRHYLAAIVSVSLLGTLLSPVTMADEGHAAANLPEVNIVDGFSTLVEAVKPRGGEHFCHRNRHLLTSVITLPQPSAGNGRVLSSLLRRSVRHAGQSTG